MPISIWSIFVDGGHTAVWIMPFSRYKTKHQSDAKALLRKLPISFCSFQLSQANLFHVFKDLLQLQFFAHCAKWTTFHHSFHLH